MIIECLECGEKNQAIQPPRPGKNYRCGKCGAAITFLQTVDTQGGINIQTPRTPPKMNVVLLIILGFITLAVFYPIWYLIRNDWLNHLSASKKLGSGLAIFALVIQSFSVIMLFIPLEAQVYETWETISILTAIVFVACNVILAFQVRRILIQHYHENFGMDINFSGIATFLWQEWYLQYKINRLPISGERSVDTSITNSIDDVTGGKTVVKKMSRSKEYILSGLLIVLSWVINFVDYFYINQNPYPSFPTPYQRLWAIGGSKVAIAAIIAVFFIIPKGHKHSYLYYFAVLSVVISVFSIVASLFSL